MVTLYPPRVVASTSLDTLADIGDGFEYVNRTGTAEVDDMNKLSNPPWPVEPRSRTRTTSVFVDKGTPAGILQVILVWLHVTIEHLRVVLIVFKML